MHNLLIRKYLLLLFALFLNGFGIVLITKAALGTSPISSLPYVMSLASPLTFGGYTFILNICFILIEMCLMGKDRVRERRFELLCQVPIVFVFSFFVDFSMFLLRNFTPAGYLTMIASLVVGCCILSSGIGWAVVANVTMNPGEYLVNVIAKRFNFVFGNVKLCFDCSLVVIAILLSLFFMHAVVGIREGTVISALLVGPLVRLFFPAWRVFNRFLRPA